MSNDFNEINSTETEVYSPNEIRKNDFILTHPLFSGPPKTKKRKKSSIFIKLFIMITASLFLMLAITLLLNNFILEPYYKTQKEEMLIENFNKIDDLLNEGSGASNEKLQDELYIMASQYNIQVAVRNRIGSWVSLSSENVPIPMLPDSVVIPQNEKYLIIPSEDMRSSASLIALVGVFDNKTQVVMTTSYALIEESVSVTNNALFISGGVAFLLSAIILIFMTRSFTKPIITLTKNAELMSELDFSIRNPIKGNDEISRLGESMNSLALSLETSISHLKSANLRLIHENEQKTMQNEAHKAFISNVSHELKTPLAILQTYAENLRENIDSGIDPAFYCDVIEDEVEKMDRMIKKLTMLMQLQSGKEQLDISRFDVVELANHILKAQQRLNHDRAIKINFLDSSAPIFVWGDAFLIEHVLTNYITNAFHHVAENGEISVFSKLFESNENTDKKAVRISVYNSGAPIAEQDIYKIWDSFYKADKARTREYGGTGIGLSVVSAIMKAHNMPYGVVNHPDGVEFYFELETD